MRNGIAPTKWSDRIRGNASTTSPFGVIHPLMPVVAATSVDLVMTRVEQRLWQEEGHFREDALNGVECGVLGWVEGRAQRPVGARQGRAQVWVAAAPAARVTWCVYFKHHSNAPVTRVLHERNHVSVAVALKLAVSGAKSYTLLLKERRR